MILHDVMTVISHKLMTSHLSKLFYLLPACCSNPRPQTNPRPECFHVPEQLEVVQKICDLKTNQMFFN